MYTSHLDRIFLVTYNLLQIRKLFPLHFRVEERQHDLRKTEQKAIWNSHLQISSFFYTEHKDHEYGWTENDMIQALQDQVWKKTSVSAWLHISNPGDRLCHTEHWFSCTLHYSSLSSHTILKKRLNYHLILNCSRSISGSWETSEIRSGNPQQQPQSKAGKALPIMAGFLQALSLN